jgi:hypothetical protein
VPKHVWEHGEAFGSCLEKSDLFLRKYLNGKERGVVVAEDVPHNKKFLTSAGLFHRRQALQLEPEHLAPSRQDVALGLQPEPTTLQITKIIDHPNYVTKNGAPLLQLADACAFAFRRYLERQRSGEELILAMLGPGEGRAFIDEPLWFRGTSSGLFNTERYWPDEQRERIAGYNARLQHLAIERALAAVGSLTWQPPIAAPTFDSFSGATPATKPKDG